MSPKERKKMVGKRVDISLARQCKILKISRSSLYYMPVGFNAETLELMRLIDRVFTQYPFFGSRQIAAYLPRKGYHAGRHRIQRLMKVMGLEAIYKRPKRLTSCCPSPSLNGRSQLSASGTRLPPQNARGFGWVAAFPLDISRMDAR